MRYFFSIDLPNILDRKVHFFQQLFVYQGWDLSIKFVWTSSQKILLKFRVVIYLLMQAVCMLLWQSVNIPLPSCGGSFVAFCFHSSTSTFMDFISLRTDWPGYGLLPLLETKGTDEGNCKSKRIGKGRIRIKIKTKVKERLKSRS